MASHRPSFSGLLSHVPESVRRDVEPPDFFAAFPQLVQPLTRVPLSVDDNDVPVANGLAPTSAESASATGERMLRCVCVSDTHNAHRRLVIPPADVLIHSGDFSDIGLPHDVNEFCDWLDSLTQVKHKVVVAGNHDLSLDRTSYPRNWKRFNHPKAYDSTALINRLKQSCIYLDHECVDIEGVRFFGSPYQPEFYDWAFNLGRENFECYDKWASIADVVRVHQANAGGEGRGSSGTASMVDVLITHGPPLGVLDLCEGNRRQGCLDLLDFTLAARPRLHVFGHIHEEFGLVQHQGTGTIYCNASMMDVRMRMLSPVDGGGRRVPIVVDVPIPAQHKRLRNCVSTAVPGSS